MSLLRSVLGPLRLRETVGLDLDDPSTTLVHREIIRSKPFLERLYRDWYRSMHRLDGGLEGTRLEIGSGGGFIQEVIPQVQTSDVQNLPHIDHVLSGEDLPFGTSSLAAVYMLNTLHHVTDPLALLREIERCLKPGGRMVCIEPAPTAFGKFVYKWLHHEPIDVDAGLTLSRSDRPLSLSNSALPWILFVREPQAFQAAVPGLSVTTLYYHTPFRYLISGGVSFRCLVPNICYKPLRAMEQMLSPLSPYLGMFMTVVLERRRE